MWKPARYPLRLLPLAALASLGCGGPTTTGPGAQHPAGAVRLPIHLQALTGTHAISVFPARDAITCKGFRDTTALKVEVLRVDATRVPLDYNRLVTIGEAVGHVDATGRLAINQPGGVCWLGFTPALLPGDVIRATLDDGSYQETRVAFVACSPPLLQDGELVVHGNAQDGFGNPLPLAQLQQRMVARTGVFQASASSEIRAGALQAGASLAYDPLPINPGDWTAIYPSLAGSDLALAAAADARAVWLGSNPAADNEETVFENIAVKGAMPGCLPPIASGVTTSVPAVITPADVGRDLSLGGTAAANVTEVAVTVNQGEPIKVALPVNPLPQAWSLVVPAARIGSPQEGPWNVLATFTVPAGAPVTVAPAAAAPAGVAYTIQRESLANAVVATPPAGSYLTPQSVDLRSATRGASIYYTLDGSEPSTASLRYQGLPIPIRLSTTLKAFAVFPDGNTTQTNVWVYRLGMPFAVNAEPPGGTYNAARYVNLVADRTATIFYTLDGRDPSPASARFDGNPLVVNVSATLRYMAVDRFGNQTPVVKQVYTIHDIVPPTLTLVPDATPTAITVLRSGQPVVVEADEDSTIFYTTDGSEPTPASARYDRHGIVLAHASQGTRNQAHQLATTLKVMAIDLAGNQSPTLTALYRY